MLSEISSRDFGRFRNRISEKQEVPKDEKSKRKLTLCTNSRPSWVILCSLSVMWSLRASKVRKRDGWAMKEVRMYHGIWITYLTIHL